jgi:anti-sigma factor ChrR (cupin superfamily)
VKDIMQDENDDALPPDVMERIAHGLRPQAPPPARAAALRASVLSSVIASRQGNDELLAAAAALREITRSDAPAWRETWPGIELCMLREGNDERAYLMRMRAGAVLPAHAHRREELSLIVEGDAVIAGRTLGPGDYDLMPAGIDHAEIRSVNGCIAFVYGQAGFQPKLSAALVAGLVQLALQRFTR